MKSDDDKRQGLFQPEKAAATAAEKEGHLAAVKSCGKELLDIIAECGNSRELSLARTNAEQAIMWAKQHFEA